MLYLLNMNKLFLLVTISFEKFFLELIYTL